MRDHHSHSSRAHELRRTTGLPLDKAQRFLDDLGWFCVCIAKHFRLSVPEIDRNVVRAVARTQKLDKERFKNPLTTDDLTQLLDKEPPPPKPRPEPITKEDLDKMFG